MKGSVFAPGLRAIRHSLAPLLLIQAAAVGLVVLYYVNPEFRSGANQVERFKETGGLLFASLSTAVAGGVLPQFARVITRKPPASLNKFLFQFAFFAVLGISVVMLYSYLAVQFGSSPSVSTVAKKVLADQFVYSPLFSIPLSSIAFLWEEHSFRWGETVQAIRQGRFAQRYSSLLVTCWCFWMPVLICVYSLPTELQFMLFLCADGAWSLLLVFISSEKAPAPV